MSPVAGYLSNEKHLFEYLGLEIYLSTRDQQPLVIYGRSEDQLSTVVIHFEDGVYYVTIDSPAIRSELSFMRSELVKRLNEVCGNDNKVKEIVFR